MIFRSTGTKEVAAAKRIGAQIIESFWNEAGRGAEGIKLRNDHATIGELIERYQQRAAQRASTIRSNVRSLRMIVHVVYHSGDPDEKSTSILTPDLIREFEKRQLQRAEKRASPSTQATRIHRVRNSTASYVRQARSVVALRKMKFYEGNSCTVRLASRRATAFLALTSPEDYRAGGGKHPFGAGRLGLAHVEY